MSAAVTMPLHAEPSEVYAREVFAVGAMLIASGPSSSWRPTDARLRTIADTVDVVGRERGWPIDVRVLFDVLTEIDPTWAWSHHLHSIMARFDEVASRAERIRWVLEAESLSSAAYQRAMDAAASAAEAMEDLRRAQALAMQLLSAVVALEESNW